MIRKVLAVYLLCLPLCFSGFAAGMTTHMYMTEQAAGHVRNAELKSLLESNRRALLSGSIFPDVGGGLRKLPGQHEEGQELYVSHSPRFMEAYLAHVRKKCAPEYADCDELVAHFLGTAAHYMEDNVYDSVYQYRVYKIDLADKPKKDYELDTNLDMVTIVNYKRWFVLPRYKYPLDDLLAVYSDLGFEFKPWQIRAGSMMHRTALVSERLVALPLKLRQDKITPWADANIYSAPGGIDWCARVVADYWEALWKRLHGREDQIDLLLGSYPVEGGQLETFGDVTAYFARGVDKATVTPDTFFVTGPEGRRVEGKYEFRGSQNPYSYAAYIIPFEELTPGQYRLTLKSGITDITGRTLGRDRQIDFQVQ